MGRECGKYLGDNDATCPQLTCLRLRGHQGQCDNTYGEPPGMRPTRDACNHCHARDGVLEVVLGQPDNSKLLVRFCRRCREELVTGFVRQGALT